MASDSDGSAAVLRSIREKLVEYKESLLRQLVEEREAAEAQREDEEEGNQSAEQAREADSAQEEAHEAGGEQEQADEAGAAAGTGDASADVEMAAEDAAPEDSDEPAAKDEPAAESPVTEGESPAVGHEEPGEDDAVLKKRRLAETSKADASVPEEEQAPAKKVKKSKTEDRKQATTGAGELSDADDKPTSAVAMEVDASADGAEAAEDASETLPPGTPYRVVRTSVPPRKYLLQTRREEEASERKALVQQQPVLLSSSASGGGAHATSNGGVGIKRPTGTPRSSSLSVDHTSSEFERKLRDSVRLHREVNRRSLSFTRKRQLPRLPTPARSKSHWDFLLEEMKWMATDFAQERNWKRVMQRHLAADVITARNAESVRHEQENRQMARGVALQVSAFWRTMERIAARSRVRFEAAGTEASPQDDSDSAMLGDQLLEKAEDDSKQMTGDEINVAGTTSTNNDMVALKFHTIDVASSDDADEKDTTKPEEVLTGAKNQMAYIVGAGKRARSAMSSLPAENSNGDKSATSPLRETAFQELQARCSALQAKGGPTIILAAFQLLALRWMLDLYSSGLNIFLNDQLGMGKAATIVAFLSLIEIVHSQQVKQEGDSAAATPSDAASASSADPVGPHLIIAAEEELHMWRYFLRVWHPDRRIQMYDSAGKAPSCRDQLQREWKTKPRAHAHRSEEDFLVAPPDDEDDEMEDDERAQPVYCVLCPISSFVQDQSAFVKFTNWQMVVVENEHDSRFDDPACVSALQQLRQRQRRILCNGQPVETWSNTALRLQYAEFLVREASATESTDTLNEKQHRVETWPTQQLLVERTSVVEVMQLYGKSASARASLWKASAQQEGPSHHIDALLLALSCLSLRRVRSEVEPQLGKIEEISLSCQPSPSQKTQYRNALSGFGAMLDAAGGREERLNVWLQLLLRLREICNCVDIVNDLDKLAHADLRLLTSCSAKLEALEPLLRRLAVQEGKKVVIYCQFSAMFPILELFLSLLDISYVRVTGTVKMQHRALCHFADRPVVRVALASTRLSMSKGKRAVSVFGGEAIVVVDSDWNATCDAKLRASWAKMAVGGADTLPVYRLHCEDTIEASLLRAGASLTEKVFGEMSPQELLAVPSDMASSLVIEKPSWWSSASSSSGGNGLTSTGTMASLGNVAQEVEIAGKYCGSTSELEMPLLVHNVDLDAEEHLLLANTDELTPVEWYAVNYVHGVTDKKGEGKRIGRDADSVEDESYGADTNAFFQSDERSFEELATIEADRQWKECDAESQLFYHLDDLRIGSVDETGLENLFMQMRMEGVETHFDVYKPPQPPSDAATLHPVARLSSDAGSTASNQMTFRVSYRVPAPPPPAPLGKSKADHAVGLHGDAKGTKLGKKQRANSIASSKSGISGSAMASGVKRKLESQLGGLKSGSQKEQRVDLEGIPVPDVSEFADDDFWGDTNLDALDSAEWDDPALLSGILGVGGAGTASSSTASSSGGASSGGAAAGAAGATGAGSHGDGHSKAGTLKGSKKSKTGTGSGRSRKSSMSGDSGRDAWTAQDDIVLKKLFELYGANWTLIAQVFNSATAVSRFFCKKRSPRQCYDRYGKIISGSLAASGNSAGGAGSTATKDGKAAKAHRAAAAASAAAAQLTPAVLDARVGLPPNEMVLAFPLRHSLPGLPPPSIVGSPSLVEMTLKHRQKVAAEAGNKANSSAAGGLDDLKSIKSSFDAIIQCMKHKTSPPPIPIPVGGAGGGTSSTAPASSTPASASAASTDLGTKASLTAASFSSPAAPTSTTPTKASPTAKTPKKAPATKTASVVVPPPHKSHTDMISLLPTVVLSPDEVIKRSKEAAVVAVQAAAAVASVGRDGSPLSASADVMLGAGSGFGATVGASMPRRSHAASLTSEMGSVNVMAPTAVIAPSVPGSKLATGDAAASAATSQPGTNMAAAAWGGMVPGVNPNGLNPSAPMDLPGSGNVMSSAPVTGDGAEASSQRNAPMPVTTSTLLHVLDRMPEIKNKIQAILNRTDCSESQKVAMIARLLSNTNAINNTNAIGGTAAAGSQAAPSAPSSSAVLSALTADADMINSSGMLIDTEAPIPMPASLAAPSPPNVAAPATSSALASSGQFQPPTSQ